MSSIKLTADSGGGTVELKAPATTGSNAAKQFILPQNDGSSGQFMKTDGSGNFAFATVTDPTISISRTVESGALSGGTNYDFTLPANCFRVDFVGHNISTSGSGSPSFRVGTSAGILSSGNYNWGEDGTADEYESSQNQIDCFDTNLNASGDVGEIYMSFLASSATNMWIFRGIANRRTQAGNMSVVGVIDLGGNALTTVRFFPFGTGFDTGRFSYTAYSTT